MRSIERPAHAERSDAGPSGGMEAAIGLRESGEEHAGLTHARDFGNRLGGENQHPARDRAQTLERQQRAGRVIEHARAPDHSCGPTCRDHARIVHVSLPEAHAGEASHVLGSVGLGGWANVETGDGGRPALLGQERNRPVNAPHASDVGKRSVRRVPADQFLARPPGVERAHAPANARRRDPGAGEHGHPAHSRR